MDAHTVNAINLLLTSTPASHQQQEEANQHLMRWQESHAAWEEAMQILTGEVPVQVSFFCAQTLRSKVLRNFRQLTNDQGISLRDSIFIEISRRQKLVGETCVVKQLILTLADLSMGLPRVWATPVRDVLEHMPKAGNGVSLTLEFLKCLPEELCNPHLDVAPSTRAEARKGFQDSLPQVLDFLQTSWSDDQLYRLSFEVLNAWVCSNCLLSLEQIIYHPLVGLAKTHLSNPVTRESAGNLLADLIIVAPEYPFNEAKPLLDLIISGLPAEKSLYDFLGETEVVQGRPLLCLNLTCLRPLQFVESSSDAFESVCLLTRIYCNAGELLIALARETPFSISEGYAQNGWITHILFQILACFRLPDFRIQDLCLDVLKHLAGQLVDTGEHVNQILAPYFRDVLSIALFSAQWSGECQPMDSSSDISSEFQKYRSFLRTVVSAAIRAVGGLPALNLVNNRMRDSFYASSVSNILLGLESHLCLISPFLVANQPDQSPRLPARQSMDTLMSVDKRASIPPEEEDRPLNSVLPEVFEVWYFLLTQTDADALVPLRTVIKLTSALSKFIYAGSEFCQLGLNRMYELLMSSPPPYIREALVSNFRFVCLNEALFTRFLPSNQDLLHIYWKTLDSFETKYHLVLIEGIVRLLYERDLPAHEFTTYFGQLAQPLTTVLTHTVQTKVWNQEASEALDRVTRVLSSLRLRSEAEEASDKGGVCLEFVEYMYHIARDLVVITTDPYLTERLCRVFKHSIRACTSWYVRLLPELSDVLVNQYAATQATAYLYLAEIMASSFCRYPNSIPQLTSLYNRMVSQCMPSLRNREVPESLVEDFFRMSERFLQACPELVFQCPNLAEMLQLLPRFLRLTSPSVSRSVYYWTESFINATGNCETECLRLPDYGYDLVREAILVIKTRPPAKQLELIAHLLVTIYLGTPLLFPEWIEQAIQSEMSISFETPADIKIYCQKFYIPDGCEDDEMYNIVFAACQGLVRLYPRETAHS